MIGKQISPLTALISPFAAIRLLALDNRSLYSKAMENSDQEAFVRERKCAEILAAIDEAEKSLAKGRGRAITEESMRDLAEQVKRHGRDRLKRKQPYSR